MTTFDIWHKNSDCIHDNLFWVCWMETSGQPPSKSSPSNFWEDLIRNSVTLYRCSQTINRTRLMETESKKQHSGEWCWCIQIYIFTFSSSYIKFICQQQNVRLELQLIFGLLLPVQIMCSTEVLIRGVFLDSFVCKS